MLSPLQLLRQITFRWRPRAMLEDFAARVPVSAESGLAGAHALGPFVGRWTLIGDASFAAETVDIDIDSAYPDDASDWLNGNDHALEAQITASAGVELEIGGDGNFVQRITGPGNLRWFNAEGVLSDISPSAGKLVFNRDGAGFLRLDEVPKWDLPKVGEYGKAVLRLDDGDVQISDGVRVQGSYLIRTTNVVINGRELHRGVSVYRKPPPVLRAVCP